MTAGGITAIVLAGGRSSRFGGEKLALDIDGMTLLDRSLAAVAAVAGDIVVAGPARPTWRAIPDVTIRNVLDAEMFGGPLAALVGALRSTTTSLAVIVGGDMPALVPAVLEAMLVRLASDAEVDAVLLAQPTEPAQPGGDPARRQTLPLALDVAAASTAAKAALEAGDRSLVQFLDRVRSVELAAAEWLALDPAGRTLLDVDRPSDLERIRRELR